MTARALPLSSPPSGADAPVFHELVAHAWRSAPAGMGVFARVQRVDGAGIRFEYRVTGSVDRIRIPGPASAGPADGLWRHTCFEAFVATEGEDRYVELNFSPSGRWARYAFSGERVRDPSAEIGWAGLPGPVIEGGVTSGSLWLSATVSTAAWPARPWRVGLTAVLEAEDGALSHWALHHPRPQPDFHHADGRRLRVNDL